MTFRCLFCTVGIVLVAAGCGSGADNSDGPINVGIPAGFPQLAPSESAALEFTLDGNANLYDRSTITGIGNKGAGGHTVVFKGPSTRETVLLDLPEVAPGFYSSSGGVADIAFTMLDGFYGLGSLCGSRLDIEIVGSSSYAAWGSISGTACDPQDITSGVSFGGHFSALLPGVTTYDIRGL